MKSSLLLSTFLLPLALASASHPREILYTTDFSDFETGPDQLIGTDGWLGNLSNRGIHGIDNNLISDQGKTAYIGGVATSAESVTVYRPFEAPEGATRFAFQTLIGISESLLEPGQDVFCLTFFTPAGDFLASINFDTTDEDFGLWTDNGDEAIHTGEEFILDYPHTLTATLDLETNRWSAELDGIPIFENTLLSTRSERSLGAVAAEWKITDPGNPGDNWMLFDDWSIFVEQVNTLTVPELESSKMTETGFQMSWIAQDGYQDLVQHSIDGANWMSDLSNADNLQSNGSVLTFVDPTAPDARRRLYRILRQPES